MEFQSLSVIFISLFQAQQISWERTQQKTWKSMDFLLSGAVRGSGFGGVTIQRIQLY